MSEDPPPEEPRPSPPEIAYAGKKSRWQEAKLKKLREGAKLPSLARPSFVNPAALPAAPSPPSSKIAPAAPAETSSGATPPPNSFYAPEPPPRSGDAPFTPSNPSSLNFEKMQRFFERRVRYNPQPKRKQKPNVIAELLKEWRRIDQENADGPKRKRSGPRDLKYTILEDFYRAGWKVLDKGLLAKLPPDFKLLNHFSNLLDIACHRLELEGCGYAVLPPKKRSEWAIVCTWLMLKKTHPSQFYERLIAEGGTEKIRRKAAKARANDTAAGIEDQNET